MALLCQADLATGPPDKSTLYPGVHNFTAEHGHGLMVSTLRAMWEIRRVTQDMTNVMMEGSDYVREVLPDHCPF